MITIHQIKGHDEPMEILQKLKNTMSIVAGCRTAEKIVMNAITSRKLEQERVAGRLPPPRHCEGLTGGMSGAG